MTSWIPAGFRCIEQQQCWSSADLTSEQPGDTPAAASRQAIILSYDESAPLLVKAMVNAIHLGHQLDKPVIFLRDNRTPIPDALPDKFCVGLQTSGTTGVPKLVFHQWDKLLPAKTLSPDSRWLLCYHPMSFAGLQVILQAVCSGATLIADTSASLEQKSRLALTHKVNAISLSPSQFKVMSLCWQDDKPQLTRLTFGGEICDQHTLELARDLFPDTSIRHIYAATEAGVVFTVADGKAGFPADWLGKPGLPWLLEVKDEELVLVRDGQMLATGDRVSLSSERCLFKGRLDSIANVAGAKVDLEALEQEFMALSGVVDCRAYTRANPITGALVCLEVVAAADESDTRSQIDRICTQLPPTHRPRIIQFTPHLTLSQAGKKIRSTP